MEWRDNSLIDLKDSQEEIKRRVNNLEIPEEDGWQMIMEIQNEIDKFNILFANIG